MSWFTYGQHTEKHIGVWLRYRSNPDIQVLIKKSRNKRFHETIERILVKEYDNGEVILEVWCMSAFANITNKYRYNVFYLKIPVNENWVCEGDAGNGTNF